MRKAQWSCALLVAALGTAGPAVAEWSIGINLSTFPQLEPVPGCPVYYAPRLGANYFLYDGKYWAYAQDGWYTSSWYNGPWDLVDPYYVPLDLLQVPVNFYQRPPAYFRGWRADAPPRWAEHWGDGWLQHRADWIQPRHGRMPDFAALAARLHQIGAANNPMAATQRSPQDWNSAAVVDLRRHSREL